MATKLHKELRFDSLSAMANYIEANKQEHNHSKNGYLNNPYADQKTAFRGGTYSECIDKLRNGSSKLLEEFVSTHGDVLVAHSTEDTQYDVQGSFVDVGAFVSGAPECMVNFVQQDEATFCDVVINLGYSSKTTHKAMFAKYIYVVKLIDALESKGTRCKIVAMCSSEGSTKHKANGNFCDVYVDVKHYHDTLPLAHLLFICCDPLFLRVGIICLQHIHLEEIGFSYAGCCFSVDYKRPTCDVFIQSMYSDKWRYEGTTDDFMKWVICNGING